MSAVNFYIIYIDRQKNASYADVKEKMNLAIDWYNINSTLWIIYTTSDEEKWYSRLEPLVIPGGHLFICKLDISRRQGWMKKGLWKWLRREKDKD